MRTLTIFILVLFSFQVWGQKLHLTERLDYLKSHKLFVVRVEFEHKKLNKEKLDSIHQVEDIINKNLEKCIDTFWDLNDSIFYIDLKDLKQFSKLYPEEVFLNFKNEYYYGFMVNIRKKKKFFRDISPRLLADTSLLGITQEIRLLRYNIIHGDVLYEGADASKKILILDEPEANEYHKQFIEDYKNKYPESYILVDRAFLNNAIYSRDPRYIYIYRLSIINIEDGSLLMLN